MTDRVMRLIDRNTGEMECTVCGKRHYANIKDGHYSPSAYKCENRCTKP